MTVYIALVTLGCHNIVSYNRNFSSCQFKEAGWNAVETHKSVTVSRSHLKHFEVSVSQSEKSKDLQGLAQKNACVALTIHRTHKCAWKNRISTLILCLSVLSSIWCCGGVKQVAIGQMVVWRWASAPGGLKKRHNTNYTAYRLVSLVRAYQVSVVV